MVFAPTSPTPACAPTGTLVSIPSISLPGRSEYRLGLGLPKAIKKAIADFRPTLMHISAPDISGYAALQLARSCNIPVVASFHTRFDTYLGYYGVTWLENAVTSYLRYLYNQCSHLYAPSESMATVLRQQNMCRDIRIWGRGIDCASFDPLKRDLEWRREHGITDDEVVIAFVGRVVMEKGLQCFAQSIEALNANGIAHRVMIVGEGPALEWFKQRLPKAVVAGFLRDHALSRAYASADIFFNPSTTETFGNVTAEAMASGLPAVCADATGSRSLVIDGVTGYLVTSNTPDAYANALARLIQDRDLRTAFGVAARNRAKTMDWDQVLDGLFEHYTDAVSKATSLHVPKDLRFGRASPAFQESMI